MREYGLTILVAAAVTYLFTPLVRRFAIAVGAEHKGRARDVHTEPVPLLGGIAMYLGLAAALLVASRLTHLSTVFMGTRVGSGLLLAGGVVVLMGFVDDRWGLGAITKLAGQVAAGAILVWSGAVVAWLPVPGGGTLSLTFDQQTALTILVVVVTINAVNFIDGLDGLAAGIVGIGAAAFFLYYYTLTKRLGLNEQTNPALASAILAGVCLGFLPHNFHPARIFMGDTGSMLLGLLLAYAPISSLASLDPNTLASPSAYSGGTVNRFPEILPLLVPAIIMLIPYADLLLAVVRRTRAGRSPFTADKKHLQHRLLAIGHSHRASVLLMYLWAVLFAGTVVLLSIMRTKLLVLVFVTLGGVLVLLLASMPRLRPWNRRGQLRLAPDVAGPVPSGAPVSSGAPGRPGAPVPSGGAELSVGAGSSAGNGSLPGLASPARTSPPGSPMESRVPAGSARDRRPAERPRPRETSWDDRPAATGWDAEPAARDPEPRPSAEAWPAPDGLTAPSNGAPSNGPTSSGGWPPGQAELHEPSQWHPGRRDPGLPDAGLLDGGLPDAGRPGAGLPDAGEPGPERPDPGQWYPGRPGPGQRDSGWWDARPHDDPPAAGPRAAGPRDASLYAAPPPPEAGQHDAGPQDLDPLSPDLVRDQPGAPRTRPVNRDASDYDEDPESPLLPWRLP